MASSLYNLAWTEFGNSLISTVQLLHYNDELTDCTLLVQEKTFEAHKLVLSAASPLLLDLFKKANCKHPVILVPGVQAADLEALLEFVYKGEVSVEQNRLSSLLQAAQNLNIQGLSAISHLHKESPDHQTDIKNENQLMQKPVISPGVDCSQTHTDEPIDKKKKYLKRPQKTLSTGIANKLHKVAHCNSETALPGTAVLQDNSAQPWVPHLNLTTSPIASVENLSSTISQCLTTGGMGSSTPYSNSISGSKVKVASDEPCACPLCGAILRQARNLRRHLLSSCRYRMVNGATGIQENFSPAGLDNTSPAKEYHTLQPLVVHNSDKESQSNYDLSGSRKASPTHMDLSVSHELNMGSSDS